MNTYAVVKLGASQQRVSLGDLVVTDRINNEVGDKVTVSDVYLFSDGDKVTVGTPVVDMKVVLEVVSHGKGDKVVIHKFKAKSRYKKTNGYRASLTTLKVLSIGDAKISEKSAKKESVKSEAKAEVKSAPKAKKTTASNTAKKA